MKTGGAVDALTIEEKTALNELVELVVTRRQFTLSISSEQDHCSVSIADAHREMTGSDETLEAAWLAMEVADLTDDIGMVIAQAQAWCDLKAAEEDRAGRSRSVPHLASRRGRKRREGMSKGRPVAAVL